MSNADLLLPERPRIDQLPEGYIQDQINGLEAQFQSGVPPEASPTPEGVVWEAETRRGHLESLPTNDGFTSRQLEEAIDRIVTIGLPVNNFTKLLRQKNKSGSENTLGSWGIGSANYGEFSLYELLDRQIPEKRIGTITHEAAHANTPLLEANAPLFGGEAKRAEAETFVRQAADQAIATEKWLNPYHKWLGRALKANEIGHEIFVEETSAILAELALTNRAHLEQVQAAQHASLDRMRGVKPAHEIPQEVALISKTDRTGTHLDGIDKTLVKLIDGVSNYDELRLHADKLKAKFYPEESRRIAMQRGAFIAPERLILDLFRQHILEEEEDQEAN